MEGSPQDPLSVGLDHAAVVAALQARLGEYWTITVRSARPGSPLIAMFSGELQRAEAKEDAPPGETDFVWYVGDDERTFGAFSIPVEGFRGAAWEPTPKGPMLVAQSTTVLVALFPRVPEP